MKYLIDLDGTILNGEMAINSSVVFINELQNKKIEFLIMTNSIKSPKLIQDRLKNVGIIISTTQIFNPIIAINSYLEQNNIQKVYVIGSQLEIDQILMQQDKLNPQIIIILDFEKNNISYNSLQEAFVLMQQKIPVIAASGSGYYLKNNIKYLDTGSFVTLFEKAANIKIPIIGKPSKEYFNAGISILKTNPSNIVVIGDDWMTDIDGAKKVGCNSILVKSGKYVDGDEFKSKPNKIVSNLSEIFTQKNNKKEDF